MTQINFTSTYRIPISQAGINTAKKNALKNFASQYPNSIVPKGNDGSVRVSVAAEEDGNFIQGLKMIGHKIYQIFDAHDVPKNKLASYIKKNLSERNYQQVGKNMKKMPTEMKAKQQYRYEQDEIKQHRKLSNKQIKQLEIEEHKERIRKTPDYLEIKKKYGKEFAEAVFFGIEK